MSLTYFFERVKKYYTPIKGDSKKNYAFWLSGTARNALVVGIGLVVARIVAATNDDRVFNLVRDVPSGLPEAQNPLGGDIDIGEVFVAAIVAALIGYLESIAIGKTFAQKEGYQIDPTQELRALGFANIVGSFFQAYPMTGSFSRTAVQNASDAKTPLAGAFTGLLVVISLVLLTPVFFYIPKAALAAIIMMSVVHMVDIDSVKSIWKNKPRDLLVWMTSFLLCLLWNLEYVNVGGHRKAR